MKDLKLKKNKLFTVLLAVTFVFFATGCKKEESIEPSISNLPFEQGINGCSNDDPISNEQGTNKGLSNISNPFDRNHRYLEQMYQDVADFLSEIEEIPDYENFEVFMNDFERFVKQYQRNNPYPEFSISKYNSVNQRVIENLVEDYMHNIIINGLEEATKQVEKTISFMSNQGLQQDMYSVVSQLHFTFDFFDNLEKFFLKPAGWWDRFDDCMRNLDWGNTVDIALCLAQGVFCPLGKMASCAWNASFNKKNK